MGSVSGVLSIASFSFYDFNFFLSKLLKLSDTSNSLPFVLLLTSAFAFSLLYLQGGGDIYKTDLKNNVDYDSKVHELEIKIEALAKKTHDHNSDIPLSELSQEDIRDRILDRITDENISSVFSSETEKLKNAIENELKYEKLNASSLSVRNRLYREISDLRLRANINLLIGMVITFLGLIILYQTVGVAEKLHLIQQDPTSTMKTGNDLFKELFLSFAPRVMLVIFIEMFAYFFLRLYKQGLSEIKYFQNELTNVESRIIALEVCHLNSDSNAMSTVIESLSKTERNFVLNKDQTTIEIEKSKLDNETTKGLMSMLQNLIKR